MRPELHGVGHVVANAVLAPPLRERLVDLLHLPDEGAELLDTRPFGGGGGGGQGDNVGHHFKCT